MEIEDVNAARKRSESVSLAPPSSCSPQAVAAAVFLVTASVNQAQDAPPEDYVAPESVDLTADS